MDGDFFSILFPGGMTDISQLISNPQLLFFLTLFIIPGFVLILYFTKTKYGKAKSLDFDTPTTNMAMLFSLVLSCCFVISAVLFTFGLIIVMMGFSIALAAIFSIVLPINLQNALMQLLGLISIIIFFIAYAGILRYVFVKTNTTGELLKSSVNSIIKSIGWFLLFIMIGVFIYAVGVMAVQLINNNTNPVSYLSALIFILHAGTQLLIIALIGIILIEKDIFLYLQGRSATGKNYALLKYIFIKPILWGSFKITNFIDWILNLNKKKSDKIIFVEDSFKRIRDEKEISDNQRLSAIIIRINCILDYIKTIEISKSKLSQPANLVKGNHPAFILFEYLIQETSSFYSITSQNANSKKIIPEYWETLKKFRNKIPGHMDSKKELKSGADWLNIYHEVFSKIRTKKILNDLNQSIIQINKLNDWNIPLIDIKLIQ